MTFPRRLKFSWIVKNSPCTDVRGPQEKFYRSVSLWMEFHYVPPSEHLSKLPFSVQGLELKIVLCGRAAGKIEKLSTDAIKSADGALPFANEI